MVYQKLRFLVALSVAFLGGISCGDAQSADEDALGLDVVVEAASSCGGLRELACVESTGKYTCLAGCQVGSDKKCYGTCSASSNPWRGCGGKNEPVCVNTAGSYVCLAGCQPTSTTCAGTCGSSKAASSLPGRCGGLREPACVDDLKKLVCSTGCQPGSDKKCYGSCGASNPSPVWPPAGYKAALSITIDDNMALDHAYWRNLSSQSGAKFTWFVITGRVQASRNAAAEWHGVWEDFRALAREGHEIGSHSHSHTVSIADIAADVKRSNSLIQANIGKAPVSFAFPDPAADTANRWKPIIAGLGYTATRGTVCGMATSKSNTASCSNGANLNLNTLVTSQGWAVAHFHNLSASQKTYVTELVRQAKLKGILIAPFGTVAAQFPSNR